MRKVLIYTLIIVYVSMGVLSLFPQIQYYKYISTIFWLITLAVVVGYFFYRKKGIEI